MERVFFILTVWPSKIEIKKHALHASPGDVAKACAIARDDARLSHGSLVSQHVGVPPSADDLISSRICGISRERSSFSRGRYRISFRRWGHFPLEMYPLLYRCASPAFTSTSPNCGICDTTDFFYRDILIIKFHILEMNFLKVISF
jgi:hypothetical protein